MSVIVAMAVCMAWRIADDELAERQAAEVRRPLRLSPRIRSLAWQAAEARQFPLPCHRMSLWVCEIPFAHPQCSDNLFTGC